MNELWNVEPDTPGEEPGGRQEIKIEKEWNAVRTRGVAERNIGKSVEPMVELKWNQVYPYSYFCPTDDNGPGGHVYVGCAADVMAMIMKYWNYPEKGIGSHSYIPEGYPEQSVDFSMAQLSLYSNSTKGSLHFFGFGISSTTFLWKEIYPRRDPSPMRTLFK